MSPHQNNYQKSVQESTWQSFADHPTDLCSAGIDTRKGSKAVVKKYKYDEKQILKDIRKYIDCTYNEHYSQNRIQTTEFIIDAGHGDGFCIGNIMKYAQRYGKKNGKSTKDLLKIIHYAIMLISANHTQKHTDNSKSYSSSYSSSSSSSYSSSSSRSSSRSRSRSSSRSKRSRSRSRSKRSRSFDFSTESYLSSLSDSSRSRSRTKSVKN
ncbi:MAG: DUF3310 domain-containing protein [Cetobacterium sp.]